MSGIVVKQITYVHPDREPLFQDISFTIDAGEKVSLVGNNGSGKSTLLKIMAGQLSASAGEIICDVEPYYIPQHLGQYNGLTVAGALRVEEKIKALHAILNGEVAEQYFSILDDDWQIEERCRAALDSWDLQHVELSSSMELLSGGEKTRVFLAGLDIHTPSVVLLDEPTNHLDRWSREKLYDMICRGSATVLVVSHDRTLLNLLSQTMELSRKGITVYGGNYDFYKEQKDIHLQSLQERIEDQQKELRLAKKIAREAAERQQKREVRGEGEGVL